MYEDGVLDSPPGLYNELKAWFTMLGCDFDHVDFDLPCDQIKVEEHLGCFQVLAIINNAAMNIIEQVSL
ncbi:hypothetical protein STEG23_012207, partial [Scotinomys teguina]